MDATVQFVRNVLCCIKDLEWFKTTVPGLYDSSLLVPYHGFAPPLDKTTPLESLISLAQFYVVWTGLPAAWRLFWGSFGKLRRIYRLMKRDPPTSTAAERLIHASLIKEAIYALRSMFVGFLVFFLSGAFTWLAANSWHITETDWIGGLPALINALTVMNICLIPLLYYMIKDGNEQFTKARKMTILSKKLAEGRASEYDVGLPSMESLSGWLPFWDAGVMDWWNYDAQEEEEKMKLEVQEVQKILHDILGTTQAKKEDGDEEKRLQTQNLRATELEGLAQVTRSEGYREYMYFMLNAIACYGYSLCIIVYYWPEEIEQPYWLRWSLLHMQNDLADWRGNFAGDMMWTIEPLVILGSPLYLKSLKAYKVKQD